MILKTGRLRGDWRQCCQLAERANRQIQVISVDARRHVAPSGTTKEHSFYIYATTEVSEILMTLGRN